MNNDASTRPRRRHSRIVFVATVLTAVIVVITACQACANPSLAKTGSFLFAALAAAALVYMALKVRGYEEQIARNEAAQRTAALFAERQEECP